MRVLLVGNGGREHALAWSLTSSPRLTELHVAPGNGGTAGLPATRNVAIAADDTRGLTTYAVEHDIDLVVVGPEVPLVAGLVDRLTEVGVRAFGPTASAARLEGSKAFSKAFMERHDIPTAASATFDDADAAIAHLADLDAPPVVKASGLAAGKGVILPESMEETTEVIRSIMVDGQFGAAGAEVVLEERLYGTEVSVLAFCDGTDVSVMPLSQDHKRALDGDLGANTGGMGAFLPSPIGGEDFVAEVTERVLLPTLRGMAAEGELYIGVLYAGLMLTAEGIRVIEFNCRFGDPETQIVLPLLTSDPLDVFEACIDERLAGAEPTWSNHAATTVVMASPGYPDSYPTGAEISGVADAASSGCTVFHAGTTLDAEGRLLTAGGRVLAVTALGADPAEATGRAYRGIAEISFDGAHYRTDIAGSVLENEATAMNPTEMTRRRATGATR